MLMGRGLAMMVRMLETARETEMGTFRNSRRKNEPKSTRAVFILQSPPFR